MQRLLGAGLLPERAGQPVRAWVHMSLAELLALDGDGALLGQWVTSVQARWAGHRAAASAGGSDGAAWLDGAAAAAVSCDALLTPVVTGEVDPAALDGLVRLCVELDRLNRLDRDPDANPGGADPGGADLGGADPADPDPGGADPGDADPEGAHRASAFRPGSPGREALELAIIGKAVDLLSGPGGLASFLRRQQLGARGLDGPPSPCGTSTAGGPAGAPSPPPPARSTTSGTRPTAAPPASKTASCSVFTIIRWSSTAGAGNWS
jgi:hypothetical protein